jgi:hypothetical protein
MNRLAMARVLLDLEEYLPQCSETHSPHVGNQAAVAFAEGKGSSTTRFGSD